MFRKQFKVKSNTQVKGSERKRIRTEVGEHFSQLTDEDLNNLFPNKESITTMKVLTHCGETVLVYSVDKIPIVFKVEKVMYPTVYMLWKFPTLLHTFTTHPVVFSKLLGGADLMLPGVVLEEPYTIKSFGHLKKGDLVSINLTDNRAPIAVGLAALSSFDMYMSAKRGKGVHVAHYNGDFLCANIKMGPPNLGPPQIMCILESGEENKLNAVAAMVFKESDNVLIDSNALSENIVPKLNAICLDHEIVQKEVLTEINSDIVDDLSARDSGVVSVGEQECDSELVYSQPIKDCVLEHCFENTNSELVEEIIQPNKEGCVVASSECENSVFSSQQLMDRLVEYSLLKALKKTVRKAEFPLLTSNLYKFHMIPACPGGNSLDIKKSSYKKLSKFLKEMEGKGVLDIKEHAKGVESIINVYYSNPLLRHFMEDDEGWLKSSSAKDSGILSVGKLELDSEEVDSQPISDCILKHSVENISSESVEDVTQPNQEGCLVANSEYETTVLSSQESMDHLMEYCLLKALKTTVRKAAFPLLTNNLYTFHMIPACPGGNSLDIKKSSYKKLSKFLKEMEGKGVIDIRELTKGVESIVSIYYSNPLLRQFVEDSDDDGDEGSLEPSSAKATEVNEMYVINATTLPLFRKFGYKKGESLMATSIRQHLTDYVVKNGLQSSNDKRFVKLDHTLSSCLRLKENEVTWKELMTSCIEQMGNSYSIGQFGSVNKGKLKPIEITVATRTGNKKVTLIENLDSYGINCLEFVKKCQHGVAASATITQLPGSKSSQVMVQGNQVIFLEKLLTGEYQIHKRFIRGLENAPKPKKHKRPISK